MGDVLMYVGILAGWIVLQRWVLPALGVPTCMSGSCSIPPGQSGRDLSRSAATAESSDKTSV